MPVLEAMACGTPVIAARGSSLDEIGGNAAKRFDHDDVAELVHVLSGLLSNPPERSHMISKGLTHAAAFTWEQTASKTRIILEDNLLT